MANNARIKLLISRFSDLANNIHNTEKQRDGVLDIQSCRPLSSSAVYRKLRVSSIGKLRDKLLNGEIFDTLLEATVLTECWRREYNRYPAS